MSNKWYELNELLNLIKQKAFPNIVPVLCKPTKREPFTVFCCNHGIFADMSLTNSCTIFDVYELEDLLEWKYQIPNQSQISYLQGQDRIIIIKDEEYKQCIAYMNGRKISYFDDIKNAFIFVSAIAEDRNNEFYSTIVDVDLSQIEDIESFMESSFITETEELYLINKKLDNFYNDINLRMKYVC